MPNEASVRPTGIVGTDLRTDGPEKVYFDFLALGDWRIPHCLSCAHAVFYPRVVCPFCHAREFDWRQPSGGGTVYSTTVMRRPKSAGGNLNLTLVDLDEGPRMMSRVVGVDPDIPKIGDRLRARVEWVDDQNIVVFTLEQAP